VSARDLLASFDSLRRRRRSNPAEVLLEVGALAAEAIALLNRSTSVIPIRWQGSGDKEYSVFVRLDDENRWSRPLNDDLFIRDHAVFGRDFQRLATSIARNQGKLVVPDLTPEEINRSVYTSVMAFAAAADLFNPSRGLGGTFFEMVVGPTLAMLTGRTETGDVSIAVPGEESGERVKVDLTFHSTVGDPSLAVPTKISTRERISQAFVHARILEVAYPGRYKTILCIVNETNAFHDRGKIKNISSLFLRETLVPRTIALYQRYLTRLDGLYYLDPPEPYLAGLHPGLPPVRLFSSLLLGDLRRLLEISGEK
jgi:hypothetical protein